MFDGRISQCDIYKGGETSGTKRGQAEAKRPEMGRERGRTEPRWRRSAEAKVEQVGSVVGSGESVSLGHSTAASVPGGHLSRMWIDFDTDDVYLLAERSSLCPMCK